MRQIFDKFLNYQEAARDLERAVDRPAYILTGDEPFLLRQTKARLVAALVTPGSEAMDLVHITGNGKAASMDAGRLLSEIETPPFFSETKVILVEKSGFFEKAWQMDGDAWKRLEQALLSIPERCCLIFTEDKVGHSNALLKKMRQQGALSLKLDRQSSSDLQRWVSALCHREGLRITREAADSLIARCELLMSDIMNELSVVFLYYAYTKQQDITLADIDQLCREDMRGKIFDLTDAIADRRIDEALTHLDILLMKREAPLFIQTMLARQTRDLLVAKELKTANRIIESGVTSSNFFARKLVGQARRFDTAQLERMLEDAFQADGAVKTGKLDGEDALSILVIKACEA